MNKLRIHAVYSILSMPKESLTRSSRTTLTVLSFAFTFYWESHLLMPTAVPTILIRVASATP